MKTHTHAMRADIFTKGFDVSDKWGHALDLINHVNPKSFFIHRPRDEVVNFDPEPVTGGVIIGFDPGFFTTCGSSVCGGPTPKSCLGS